MEQCEVDIGDTMMLQVMERWRDKLPSIVEHCWSSSNQDVLLEINDCIGMMKDTSLQLGMLHYDMQEVIDRGREKCEVGLIE